MREKGLNMNMHIAHAISRMISHLANRAHDRSQS